MLILMETDATAHSGPPPNSCHPGTARMALPSPVCREIATEFEFMKMAGQWRQLFAQCTYPTLFLSWEWVFAWWQNFRGTTVAETGSRQLRLYAIYSDQGDSSELIGLIPMYLARPSNSILPCRHLRLFGDLGGHGEGLTEETLLLTKRFHEAEVVATFLKTVTKARDWDFLTLNYAKPQEVLQVPAPDTAPRLSLTGSGIEQRLSFGTEILRLPADRDTYRRSLSKSMRDNLAYYPRLLTRHGYDWKVRAVTEHSEMNAAVRELVELHRHRAELADRVRHTNHVPEPCHLQCLQQMFSQLATRCAASVWLLEIEGKAIAALALLDSPSMRTVYYTGYDPAFNAYSPLTILNAEAIYDAIANRIPCINFLAGTDRWTARWGTKPEVLFEQVTVQRLRPQSLLRSALYRGRQYRNRVQSESPTPSHPRKP